MIYKVVEYQRLNTKRHFVDINARSWLIFAWFPTLRSEKTISGKKKTFRYSNILLFEMIKLLTVSCNATMHILKHRAWHVGTSVPSVSFKVLQCLWKNRKHLLFEASSQEKVQWSQIRGTWSQIFNTAMPTYLVPESLDEVRQCWLISLVMHFGYARTYVNTTFGKPWRLILSGLKIEFN